MPAGISTEYESYQSAIGSFGVPTRSLASKNEAVSCPVSLPPMGKDTFEVLPGVGPVNPIEEYKTVSENTKKSNPMTQNSFLPVNEFIQYPRAASSLEDTQFWFEVL